MPSRVAACSHGLSRDRVGPRRAGSPARIACPSISKRPSAAITTAATSTRPSSGCATTMTGWPSCRAITSTARASASPLSTPTARRATICPLPGRASAPAGRSLRRRSLRSTRAPRSPQRKFKVRSASGPLAQRLLYDRVSAWLTGPGRGFHYDIVHDRVLAHGWRRWLGGNGPLQAALGLAAQLAPDRHPAHAGSPT